MTDNVTATLIANTGVLVAGAGSKTLVDGIYGGQPHRFSEISPSVMSDIMGGCGLFEGIDYLLFTHEHPDHFTPGLVIEYLEKQTPKAVVMPGGGSPAAASLELYMKAKDIPAVIMAPFVTPNMEYRPQEGVGLRLYAMRHLDRLYQHVPHFCFLLKTGGKSMLFTSDVDYTYADFSVFDGMDIDALFVNPIFYHNEGSNGVIDQIIRPKKTIIYHIPFEADDSMKMRKMVQRDIERFDVKNNAYPLWDELQSVTI